MMLRSFCLIVSLLSAVGSSAHAQGAARLLYSHYAPGVLETGLAVRGEGFVVSSIEYGETAFGYEVIESGRVELDVWEVDQIYASTTVDLEPGDYSVFFHRDSDGVPTISVVRDTLAGAEFPAPDGLETPDGNAAGRFLSFMTSAESDLRFEGTAEDFLVHPDGTLSAGGKLESTFDVGMQPAIGANFPATVNERNVYSVGVMVGTPDQQGGLAEVLVSREFDMPAGTTDFILIGTVEEPLLVQRTRPDARSARVNGIYGEPGINGSGLQLYGLPEIGRIYGLLYTYAEDGTPTWYYLDSRCDLDRGFQCTTPGFLAATGSYIVAIYRASNGALAAGVDADLDIVGSGRVRVSRQHLSSPGFVGDGFQPAPANLLLSFTPPTLDTPPLTGSIDANITLELISR